MTTRFSFTTRREYAKLPDELHDELVSASKRSWGLCVHALSGCVFLAPFVVLLAGVITATLVAPLPKVAALVYAVGLMILAWFSRRLVIKLTQPLAVKSIEAACLGYLSAKANDSSKRMR